MTVDEAVKAAGEMFDRLSADEIEGRLAALRERNATDDEVADWLAKCEVVMREARADCLLRIYRYAAAVIEGGSTTVQ